MQKLAWQNPGEKGAQKCPRAASSSLFSCLLRASLVALLSSWAMKRANKKSSCSFFCSCGGISSLQSTSLASWGLNSAAMKETYSYATIDWPIWPILLNFCKVCELRPLGNLGFFLFLVLLKTCALHRQSGSINCSISVQYWGWPNLHQKYIHSGFFVHESCLETLFKRKWC